jgi:hypothetical protein
MTTALMESWHERRVSVRPEFIEKVGHLEKAAELLSQCIP